MSEAATTPLATVDAATRLRLLSCPVCAVCFAIPAELHLRRAAESAAVTCPNAHSFNVSPLPPDELHAMNAALLEEIAGLKTQAVVPVKPADRIAQAASLLADRAAILAARELAKAGGGARGKYFNCSLCNARIYFNAIANHYKKSHRQTVLDMPAEAFDR